MGVTNLTFGGVNGYLSDKDIETLKIPFSYGVSEGPDISTI